MFADTVQHVFLSPLYALAKYFENSGEVSEGDERLQSILRAKHEEDTVQCIGCARSKQPRVVSCRGFGGLELQTNAITTPFAPLYAAQGSCTGDLSTRDPNSDTCRHRDIRGSCLFPLYVSFFSLEFFFLNFLLLHDDVLYRLLIVSKNILFYYFSFFYLERV